MINVALFGKKAWQWREENPESVKRGENILDYASAEELIILINLESQNAELIKDGLSQVERYKKLKEIARSQMEVLIRNNTKSKIKAVNPNLLKGSTE